MLITFLTGNIETISDIIDKINLIEADIRDLESMRKVTKGVDFVIHQAALPSVIRSVTDPIITNEVNVSGILNMLVASRDAGAKRFVFASSSSVYGNTKTLPKTEDMTPSPLSPYAISKLIGEHYCKVFYELYGLETICLRYFNIFGPYQDPSSQVLSSYTKIYSINAQG